MLEFEIKLILLRPKSRAISRLTCMNAVAMMTPEPKYLVMKKAKGGTLILFVRAAAIGSRAPAHSG